MNLNLIIGKKLPEIVWVGISDSSGNPVEGLYLAKYGHIKVIERRFTFEAEKSRAQAQGIATKLIQRIAQEKNLTIDEVTRILSPKAAGSTEVDNGDLLLQYADSFTELNLLSGYSENEIGAAAATALIQTRAAYPVVLADKVAINDKKAVIEPSEPVLNSRQVIRFGNTKLVVDGNYPPDTETIRIAPAGGTLEIGAVGFLGTNKSYLLGYPEWTLEDTYGLSEALVEKIYEFYRNESSRWQELPVVEDTSNSEGEELSLPAAK